MDANRPSRRQPLVRAYQGDPLIKANLLRLLHEDYEAGRIVQGHYWDGSCGCLIGCATRRGAGQHERYADAIGVPYPLPLLFDRIFEGLPLDEARAFVLDLHEAIPVGADLSPVAPHLFVRLLSDPERGAMDRYRSHAAEQEILRSVLDLYTRWLAGNVPAEQEWRDVLNGAAEVMGRDAGDGDAHCVAYHAVLAAHDRYGTNDLAYTILLTGGILIRNRYDQFQWVREVLLSLVRAAPVPADEQKERSLQMVEGDFALRDQVLDEEDDETIKQGEEQPVP